MVLKPICLLLFAYNLANAYPRIVRQARSLDGTTASKSDLPPEIYSLNVKSQIFSRFATTLITSRLANRHDQSREAVFVVQLPDAAFISNFSMKIDGIVILGEVKEKEQAEQEYEEAKSLGQSAGHIAQAPRQTNTFHISVNVAAMGKVTFNLTYQEILQRVHGVYKHIVNIQPGQVVNDLKVDVFITEAREITTIHVPEFGEKVGEKTNKDLLKLIEAQDVTVKSAITPELSHVHVIYHPNAEKQKDIAKDRTKGLAGQLVVLYDVARDQTGGDVQVVNGYFVHFFAPSDLPLSNKDTIFVLDTSGSMDGRKIAQTKPLSGCNESYTIEDLSENDLFNILEFNDFARAWKSESVHATSANKKDAANFVQSLVADGGTNINDALREAVKKLLSQSASNNRNPVIIFLTDGQATTGIIDNQSILNNVKETNNEGKVSVQSIGFGSGADFDLLKRLSLENHGLARKVYEDSDAALQLEGFHSEISSLLLTKVQVKYLNENVDPDSIVQDNTYNYYNGSEFVIVGKFKKSENVPKYPTLDAKVNGLTAAGPRSFDTTGRSFCDLSDERTANPASSRDGWVGWSEQPGGCIPFPWPPQPLIEHPEVVYEPLPPQTLGGFVERMWAYLSIKKLLEKSKYDSEADSEEFKAKALDLSLKYHFVTELTSMVVTQPGKNKSQPLAKGETQKPMEYDEYDLYSSAFMGAPPPPQGRRGYPGPQACCGYMLNVGHRPTPPPPPPLPATHTTPTSLTTKTKYTCSVNETMLGHNCEHSCDETYMKGQKCQPNGSCKCFNGYLRATNGRCVKYFDCPNVPKCSDLNAYLSRCGVACPQKSCQSIKQRIVSIPCKICAPPACVCKRDYVLDLNGNCLDENDCT